ncbi:DUF1456 family protein [Planococcus salinus]|uniref:DUF1456 family protein n=1 Tax=Planococcus salinus TaxID=1848460 RepID=A0A3M8P5M6_9BACL|nr:DUF1456 family protein [Planococcus salinus]RNF38979.1 DUF1456 family protein [Planococcus salinus]
MDNNDILIRLRYALDIKDSDVAEIFKLGGAQVSQEEVPLILTKTPDFAEEEVAQKENIPLDNDTLEAFLNGLIIFKRGRQEGQPETPALSHERINNLVLKKVKIALQLTSEDMLEIFKAAKFTVSKGEIGAFLRKEGHKNYKECGDQITRNFLKGLAIKYRGEK